MTAFHDGFEASAEGRAAAIIDRLDQFPGARDLIMAHPANEPIYSLWQQLETTYPDLLDGILGEGDSGTSFTIVLIETWKKLHAAE